LRRVVAARLRWAGRDPWQNPLDILIRKVLKTRVRCPSSIVLPQHVCDRIGVKLLCLGQQPVRFLVVPDRLFVQSAFGKPARLGSRLGWGGWRAPQR
jgi:hypothetical protein